MASIGPNDNALHLLAEVALGTYPHLSDAEYEAARAAAHLSTSNPARTWQAQGTDSRPPARHMQGPQDTHSRPPATTKQNTPTNAPKLHK